MNMFNGKTVAVLGLGVEGASAVQYLVEDKATVTVFDEREEKEFEKDVLSNLKKQSVRLVFGPFGDFSSFNYLVRSPGIKLSHPSIQKAVTAGAVLTSATKIFFDECPCPIVGVTGTKGKGTTSSLIYEMLKEQGRDVYLGGNIGTPPLDFLEKLTSDSVVVLELSSFQLEDLTKSPHVAVVLMVTSEHLAADTQGTQNFHDSLEAYIDAKRNILKFQTKDDFAVVNHDYPASNESDIHTDGRVYYVSREQGVWQGAYIKDNAVWLKMEEHEVEVIKVSEVLLPGKHNLENVCAAILGATLAGAMEKSIIHVLKTFKGLEHRLELVATVQGVRYYDDSFSTTPETAIAAIQAFTDPEILILGGSHKGSDFTELGRIIPDTENIKAIIGIGGEWNRIKERLTIHDSRFKIIEGCKTMEEIVRKAAEISTLGDVVLLSPACASFDMFKNYKERGEQFKEEVFRLKERIN